MSQGRWSAVTVHEPYGQPALAAVASSAVPAAAVSVPGR